MEFTPRSDYRYAFRKGDEGIDVAILQLNLPNVLVDGVFGKRTKTVVENWQERHHLEKDGVAGLATSRSIISSASRSVTTKYGLPKGMLKSIAFNESSFKLANAGKHNGDEGWDVGAFARSSGPNYGSDEFHASAFNVKESAEWTGAHAVEQKSRFVRPVDSQYLFELATGDRDKLLWQLTVLAHNWPDGADNICRRGGATVDFTGDVNRDDEPAEWIEAATRNPHTGISLLHTPRQWVMSYVTKATAYVDW